MISSHLLTADSTASLTASTSSVKNAPIGLFDSGIGGLSVYMHLRQALPNERYIYYADTLNVPYGCRSSEEIIAFTKSAVVWLIAAGCKLIVIACNSASAHALDMLRKQFPDVPIVGLVPALKPAVVNSRSHHVAVLATQATLNGYLLNQVIADYAVPNGVEVIKWFDPNLVPWVELGMPSNCQTAVQLKERLHFFAKQKVDYLVLGCTHYPFFREFLVAEISAHNLGIRVIDSGAAIANRVKDVLSTHDKLAPKISLQTPQTSVTVDNIKCLQYYSQKATHKPPPSLELEALYVGVIGSEGSCYLSDFLNLPQLSFYMTNPNSNLAEARQTIVRLIEHSTDGHVKGNEANIVLDRTMKERQC